MKKSHQLKIFFKALSKFHDRTLFKGFYQNDKRITVKEKQIIGAWQLLKISKFDEIIQLLETSFPEHEMAEAQRLLILGITYNNKSIYNQAVVFLEKSILIFEKYDDDDSIFTVYYNLFIAYLNAKNDQGMKKSLIRLEKMPLENQTREILFYQCQFNYYSFKEELSTAGEIFNTLDKLKNNMTDSMLSTHLVSGFCFYVKCRDFEKCHSILEELKTKKNFHYGANFKFMKMLLLNLTENKPLYAYKNDFDTFPTLYNQLLVIQNLESGQINTALESWQILQSGSPVIYLDNFEYSGDTNIFSLCLEKYRPNKNSQVVSLEHLPKEEAILKALMHSQQWINKEELYRMVWGQELQNKTELNRLQQCIAKLRERGIDITYKKSAYKIESIVNKKVS